jgi:hypothetical protein
MPIENTQPTVYVNFSLMIRGANFDKPFVSVQAHVSGEKTGTNIPVTAARQEQIGAVLKVLAKKARAEGWKRPVARISANGTAFLTYGVRVHDGESILDVVNGFGKVANISVSEQDMADMFGSAYTQTASVAADADTV